MGALVNNQFLSRAVSRCVTEYKQYLRLTSPATTGQAAVTAAGSVIRNIRLRNRRLGLLRSSSPLLILILIIVVLSLLLSDVDLSTTNYQLPGRMQTKLLHKLHYYGVRNKTLRWIQAFLTGRRHQQVALKKKEYTRSWLQSCLAVYPKVQF